MGQSDGRIEFGHESHLLQHEAAGGALDLRQIREADVHAGVEQHGEKSDRAGEPVEAGFISDRTKAALVAAKRRGKKLGGFRAGAKLTAKARQKGADANAEAAAARAAGTLRR
jgi:hypothetical protein